MRNVIGASAELDLQHEQKKENGAAVSTKTRRQQQQRRRRRSVAAAAAAAAALSSSGRVSRNPERERERAQLGSKHKPENGVPNPVERSGTCIAEKADEV